MAPRGIPPDKSIFWPRFEVKRHSNMTKSSTIPFQTLFRAIVSLLRASEASKISSKWEESSYSPIYETSLTRHSVLMNYTGFWKLWSNLGMNYKIYLKTKYIWFLLLGWTFKQTFSFYLRSKVLSENKFVQSTQKIFKKIVKSEEVTVSRKCLWISYDKLWLSRGLTPSTMLHLVIVKCKSDWEILSYIEKV